MVSGKGKSFIFGCSKRQGPLWLLESQARSIQKHRRLTGVAEKIAKAIPSARFIYIMRDPVERAVSHYWHMVKRKQESRDLVSAIRNDSQYRDVSNYAMQLKPYIETFGLERIKTLTFEEMVASPLETVKQVFAWLDVDSSFIPPNLDERMNVTPDKMVRIRGDGRLYRFRFSPIWRAVGRFVPREVRALGRRMSDREIRRPTDSAEHIPDTLLPLFIPEVERLSVMFGREFPEWKTVCRGV